MTTVLSELSPVAQKNYNCDACHWFNQLGDIDALTPKESLSVDRAKENKWQIVKGDKYLKQNIVRDGELRSFKAIPEMHDICIKYDYYYDE